jgi:hypothetical protein
MTVRELREKLASYSGDMPVLIPGYESGWDPLDRVEQITVRPAPDVISPGPLMPFSEPIERPDYEGAFETAPDSPGVTLALGLGYARY